MLIKEIPIVYACDEKFLKQTYISIFSVLANRRKEYKIKFIILVPERCRIEKIDENWLYDNYSIEYRHVSSQYFQNVRMTMQHITKPTYYRLLIPLMLPEYDKCIYLDGDTVCCDDIEELYDIELENNLLAASKGAIVPFDAELVEQRLNIPDGKNYINAGVLVMNLKQMRLENKTEEFLKYSDKNFRCQDQDVLNLCCFNRMKLIAMKYNTYSSAFGMPEYYLLQRYEAQEMHEAKQKPIIIHYASEYLKPWNNIHCIKGDAWWCYAEQVLESEETDRFRARAIEHIERYSFDILFKKIDMSKQVVIFGFSDIGQQFCDEVDEKFPEKVVCFCDNAKDKMGKSYREYTVLSLEEVKSKYVEALIVITSQNYSDEIQKQLREAGYASEQVAIYRKKNLNYVYSMKKEHMQEAINDIKLDSISWKECFGNEELKTKM